MAKVQIKSEKITPFGGIFHVREQFSRFVGPVIDKVLGIEAKKQEVGKLAAKADEKLRDFYTVKERGDWHDVMSMSLYNVP